MTEPLNLDGLVNQTISVSGIGWFTDFGFTFTGERHGEAGYLIDNLRFETVPEPGSLGLAISALIARRVLRRHRG